MFLCSFLHPFTTPAKTLFALSEYLLVRTHEMTSFCTDTHIHTSMWISHACYNVLLLNFFLFVLWLICIAFMSNVNLMSFLRLLNCWKSLDSCKNGLIRLSDMLKFPNYVFYTLKSSFKSFPANLSGPQNWLWSLWTHSPEGHEFKSQVGEGGCHGSLIFSSRPFPLSFPHLTQPSFRRLDKHEHQACYFCLLI